MRHVQHILLCLLTLLVLITTASAQNINLRLPDGSRWSGEVGDRIEIRALHQGREIDLTGEIERAGNRYLMVSSRVGGSVRQFTFFESDIRSIRTIEVGRKQSDEPRGDDKAATPPKDPQWDEADSASPGVFVLPLSGMVGTRIIYEHIDKMAEYADGYGPGQVIILKIDTDGGAVLETQRIADRLFEVRERHRVIAWIDKAFSAGCAIASVCHEIYFMSDGAAGAMTPHGGGQAVDDEFFQEWLKESQEWMRKGGRHPYFAPAMIQESFELSYDKDPVTGERTFYANLSGEFVLSRKGENLSLNSRQAVHSGFADGVADNGEELADLLDLPRWHEVSDYGRTLHADWHRLMDRAEDEIPRLFRDRARTQASDPVTEISRRIQITERLLRWARRLPEFAGLQLNVHEESLRQEIAEMRRQLAQMRR